MHTSMHRIQNNLEVGARFEELADLIEIVNLAHQGNVVINRVNDLDSEVAERFGADL